MALRLVVPYSTLLHLSQFNRTISLKKCCFSVSTFMASLAQKVLVLIANGTELMEAVITIDVLRRAGADVTVASVEKQLSLENAMFHYSPSKAPCSTWKVRPTLTLNFLVQFFQLALVGITTNQGFYLLGLDNTSPTFASAIKNFFPTITFLMAALLWIEKVQQDQKDKIGKVVGMIFCVAGATVITLYKGLIQFVVIALIFERDAQAWMFHCGGEVFIILYAVRHDWGSCSATVCILHFSKQRASFI